MPPTIKVRDLVEEYMRGSWELRCNANAHMEAFDGQKVFGNDSPFPIKFRERIRGQKVHLANAIKLLDRDRAAMEDVLARHGNPYANWGPYPTYPDDKLYGQMVMVPGDPLTADIETVRASTSPIVFPDTLQKLIDNNAIFGSDITTGHNRGAWIRDEMLKLIKNNNEQFIADFISVLEASMAGCQWSRECLGHNLQCIKALLDDAHTYDETEQQTIHNTYLDIPLDPVAGGNGRLAAADPTLI